MSYDKLVAALRCKGLSKKCDSCGYGYHISPDSECNDACHFEQIAEDAAAAIEALQAEMPKRGKWIETEEEEWGIYPFKKKTCSVCDCKIDHTFMLACMDYFDDRDTVFHYCPNCGADMRKMEVKDDKIH